MIFTAFVKSFSNNETLWTFPLAKTVLVGDFYFAHVWLCIVGLLALNTGSIETLIVKTKPPIRSRYLIISGCG